MGRFSYSPRAGQLSSSFGTWWGDSLTRPRLDIFFLRSARGGEILLLAPGWTSLVVVRHIVGRFSYSPHPGHLSFIIRCVMGRFSYSPHAGHLSSSFGAWWVDSLTRPMLDISHYHSARGGEILLLTPGWTSIIIVQRMVGRFSYSPPAGHLSSLFSAWWRDSLTHPGLDISHRHLVRGGEILLLAPGWTSLIVIRCMVGRFSYSPQAVHLSW